MTTDAQEETLRSERDAAERALANAQKALKLAHQEATKARKAYAAALNRLVSYRDSKPAGGQKR